MVAPKLRFKEFDHKWDQLVFSDVFSFYNTNSYSRALLDDKGEIMNIHYGDIHTKFSMLFDVSKEQIPYLGEEIDKKKIREENFLKIGDLVIADASEDYKDIGKAIEVINLDNKKVVAGLHTYIARPTKPCAVGFNGYLMQTANIRSQIQKLATGISVLGISKTNISKIQLCLPSEAEQDKIATFLSAVDEKISQLTQKHQLLSQYKQGMMQKLFSQQIRFKADDGSEFAEWKKTEIKNISKIFDGTHQTPNYVTAGVPFYSVEHVTANNFKNTKYIAEDVYLAELKRVQLEKGDILLTRIGDIGTCRLIDWDVRASFYVSLALIKVNKQHNSSFVNQYIKSNLFQKELHERTIHVAFPKKINLGEIGLCLIQLPCLEEQTKIANFLSTIDQKMDAVSEQLEQAKLWKKGLLQQMFV
jgi:type I restriction enzyme S subunit